MQLIMGCQAVKHFLGNCPRTSGNIWAMGKRWATSQRFDLLVQIREGISRDCSAISYSGIFRKRRDKECNLADKDGQEDFGGVGGAAEFFRAGIAFVVDKCKFSVRPYAAPAWRRR